MAKSVTVGSGGDEKNVPTIVIGSSGNKIVREGWIGNSGNKQFFAGLSADHTPTSALSQVGGTRAPNVGSVVVTVDGGAGGNTIAWAHTSNSTDPVINDASSFSVSWTVGSNTGQVAGWTYTVTDAHGTQFSKSVSVIFNEA